ncbi:hypothetical protein [Paenibacillus graminis]|nr:hypothetical protein [Paenibacillus graminis]MEC0173004.1 hypothetical protein [Paenibacillus graminis]
MKDWANLAVSIINLTTALILLKKATKETKEKGTKRSRTGKRK